VEPIVLWQIKWSHNILIPMYLFFGGMCAGTFIVAVLSDLLSIKFKQVENLSKVAAYAAIPMYVLAGLFVTFHLGKPERGMAYPVFFTNYNSWMVLGGWSVGIGGPFIVAYALLRYFAVRTWIRRVVGVIGIPFLVWLAVNTGLLLSNAGFVPLWSEKYLPILFLNSGVLTGLAGAGFVFLLAWPFIASSKEDSRRIVHWVSFATIIFELIEIVLLYQFMTFLASFSAEAAPTGQFVIAKGAELAYEYVTSFDFCSRVNCPRGALAPWFWWGVIGIGLAVPLVLSLWNLIVRRWERGIATAEFALIMIGGAILRFVIVWGGDLKAPLAFPPSKWPIPPLVGG
jgi:polysulfide reductase chain C